MAKNIKALLIKRLSEVLNIKSEDVPMSFPDKAFPKLGEPYRPLALPGGPYKLNEIPRLSHSDITDKVPMSYRTGGQQEIKEVVPFKGNLPESFSKKKSNLSEQQKLEMHLSSLRKKYSKASTIEEKNKIRAEVESAKYAFRGQILSPTRFKSGVSTETKTMPQRIIKSEEPLDRAFEADSTILISNPKGGDSDLRKRLQSRVKKLEKGTANRGQTTPQSPTNIGLTQKQIAQKNKLEIEINNLEEQQQGLPAIMAGQRQEDLAPVERVTGASKKRPTQVKDDAVPSVKVSGTVEGTDATGRSGNIDSLKNIDIRLETLRNSVKTHNNSLKDLRAEYKRSGNQPARQEQIVKQTNVIKRRRDQYVQEGRALRYEKNSAIRKEQLQIKNNLLKDLRDEYKTATPARRKQISEQAEKIKSTEARQARVKTIKSNVEKSRRIDEEIKNKNKEIRKIEENKLPVAPAGTTKPKKPLPEYPLTPIEAVEQKTDDGLKTILRERISPSSEAAAGMARRPKDKDILPSDVGRSDTKTNPRELEGISSNPRPRELSKEEVFDNAYQKELDNGGSHFEAIEKAEDKVDDMFGKGLTPSQIKDMSLQSSVDYSNEQGIRGIAQKAIEESDESVTDMLEAALESGKDLTDLFKKKGGQIKKPVKNKRKIKTSVRGNALVAMMYD